MVYKRKLSPKTIARMEKEERDRCNRLWLKARQTEIIFSEDRSIYEKYLDEESIENKKMYLDMYDYILDTLEDTYKNIDSLYALVFMNTTKSTDIDSKLNKLKIIIKNINFGLVGSDWKTNPFLTVSFISENRKEICTFININIEEYLNRGDLIVHITSLLAADGFNVLSEDDNGHKDIINGAPCIQTKRIDKLSSFIKLVTGKYNIRNGIDSPEIYTYDKLFNIKKTPKIDVEPDSEYKRQALISEYV
jgi:hypothetical protein